MTADLTARSRQKRDAILDAATELFLRRGYAGTSMEDVAAAAAVSKQTVYKHFSHKEELFSTIVLATTSGIDRLVETVAAEEVPAAGLRDFLLTLARLFTEAVMSPETLRLRRLVIAESERFPGLGAAWYETGFERVLTTLTVRFAALASRGSLTVEDPAIAAQHFVGLMLWIPVNRAMFTGDHAPYSRRELEALAVSGVDAFLRAYGAGPEASARA